MLHREKLNFIVCGILSSYRQQIAENILDEFWNISCL